MKKLLWMLAMGGFFALDESVPAQSWTPTGANTNVVWSSIACSADGTSLVAGLSGGAIFLSGDSGNLWSPCRTPATNTSWIAVASSADFSRLAALDNLHSLVYLSTDAGFTWTSNSLAATNLNSLALSADGSQLEVTAAGGAVFLTFLTGDPGALWFLNTLPAVGTLHVVSSADGAKLAVAAVNGSIFCSTNGGSSWQVSGAPTNLFWTCMASSADGCKLVAGAADTIFTSVDSGATWASNSLPGNLISSVASSADGINLAAVVNFGTAPVGGSLNGAVFISTNSGATWFQSLSPVGTWLGVISSADGSTLYAPLADTFTSIPPLQAGGIYTSQTIPHPALKLTPSAGNVGLSWIVPSASFTLQQNPGLSPGAWQNVSATPALDITNLQFTTVVPATNGQCFYRLATPAETP
jgi:photosystem II stability/assembly factor-like uncharacterized protein